MANPIYAQLPTTIFSVMSGLAREHGAINLGQGFPDEPGPEAIRRHAAEAVLNGDNQYPPTFGTADLRQAVARHYARRQGLTLDWQSEITVTSGATEALACAFFGLIEPGEGTVEAEAFRRMDAYARAEVDRVAASEKAEQAWREARPEEIGHAAHNPEPEAEAEPF